MTSEYMHKYTTSIRYVVNRAVRERNKSHVSEVQSGM